MAFVRKMVRNCIIGKETATIKILPSWSAAKHLKYFKDTPREKARSNKTPALRKSTNMGVWAVGTLNQLFIRGF